jgi:hypothetical protein
MRTKSDKEKISIKKMIRKKTNNNHKNKDQSWYKNQILRGEIEKKNQNKIYSNQKFDDQICYNQQIIWYF